VERFTLVVADDDVDLRAALCEVLAATPGFEVVAAVGTGYEAAEVAETTRPRVALLDVRMPGGGAEAVAAVRRRAPDTAVVAISAHASAWTVASMLKAGAVGFLAKGWGDLAITDVLRRCARGEVVVAAPSGAAALAILLDKESML
jgi:DNA-binding NarL/FixJ family response regulator